MTKALSQISHNKTIQECNTTLGLSSFWQYVAKGAVIVAAVLLDKWRQQQNAS